MFIYRMEVSSLVLASHMIPELLLGHCVVYSVDAHLMQIHRTQFPMRI